MEDKKPARAPKVIKDKKDLQKKVGTGAVDERLIQKGQAVIDSNTVDFNELAVPLVERLKAALDSFPQMTDKTVLQKELVAAIMQIKANGGMFKYELVSSLSGNILAFLESVDTVDRDIIDILAAYHKGLDVILKTGMKGYGNAQGRALETELHKACLRYLEKDKTAR